MNNIETVSGFCYTLVLHKVQNFASFPIGNMTRSLKGFKLHVQKDTALVVM